MRAPWVSDGETSGCTSANAASSAARSSIKLGISPPAGGRGQVLDQVGEPAIVAHRRFDLGPIDRESVDHLGEAQVGVTGARGPPPTGDDQRANRRRDKALRLQEGGDHRRRRRLGWQRQALRTRRAEDVRALGREIDRPVLGLAIVGDPNITLRVGSMALRLEVCMSPSYPLATAGETEGMAEAKR